MQEQKALAEILAALAQPFDARYQKTNDKGQPFFDARTYRSYLKKRAPLFETSTTTTLSACGRFCVADVSITIHGTDGSITRSENGFESIPVDKAGVLQLHKVYGDPASNASSQAFKKACRLFSMGRPANS